MTCSHNGNETIPAMPSTVTIVSNTFAVDSATTNWVKQILNPVVEGYTQFALTSLPVSGTLAVTRNGQTMVYGTDYTVTNLIITLGTPMHAGDVFEASYLAQPS